VRKYAVLRGGCVKLTGEPSSQAEIFQRQQRIEAWLHKAIYDVAWMAGQLGVSDDTVQRDIQEIRISWKKLAQESSLWSLTQAIKQLDVLQEKYWRWLSALELREQTARKGRKPDFTTQKVNIGCQILQINREKSNLIGLRGKQSQEDFQGKKRMSQQEIDAFNREQDALDNEGKS
jgi:hypothetical protein